MLYRAKPVPVFAHRIVSVAAADSAGARQLQLENGLAATATAAMLARMTPQLGDYYVIQEDGYVYLNPKDVFERKYESAEAQTTGAQAPPASVATRGITVR